MDRSTLLASPMPDSPRAGLAALAGFYRWHAPIYDWTRPLILFGRETAVTLLRASSGQVVLDVGCGTGWSLSALAGSGATVVGIECTDAMRRQAQARLRRRGIADTVHLDGRPYGTHADYEDRADRILLSYSLSMMPTPALILERARRDLRRGGRIVVVDFLGATGPMAAALKRSHVHLGHERLQRLRRTFPEHHVEVRSAGLWQYFVFCGDVP